MSGVAHADQSRSRVGRVADELLDELGIAPSPDGRALAARLLADFRALIALSDRVAELLAPDLSVVPPVDAMVSAKLVEMYGGNVDEPLLRKRESMGPQTTLLLAILLEHVGEEVPLVELLLANELHNATSRRLRELRNTHGGFQLDAVGTGRDTRYVLRSPEPRLEVAADWWLKRNIRDSTLRPHERLLALLKAYVGQPVTLREVGDVLPEARSRGRGQARAAQGALARRLRELRDLGYVVRSVPRLGYVLDSAEPGDALVRLQPKVRAAVLKRDGRRCQSCGWQPGMPEGPRPRELQVHHRDPQRARSEDMHDPRKLVTLCSLCHAGEEAELKRAIPRA